MAEPFLSEIRLFSFFFPPKGWAFCNGQLLPINQNQPLFALLGTRYGGNGQTNFALPNLQNRTPIHFSGDGNYILGQSAGELVHTLIQSEMPAHTHTVNASTAIATATAGPGGNYLGQSSGVFLYGPASNLDPMAAQAVTSYGGSQPHENCQPYLALNFCIALQGIFPSPN